MTKAERERKIFDVLLLHQRVIDQTVRAVDGGAYLDAQAAQRLLDELVREQV